MELWHRFVTLPLVVQVIAWACTGGLLLLAWLKSEAIAASIKAAKEFVGNRAAAWAAGKVQPHLASASQGAQNERIHRGYFINYKYVSHVRDKWSFEIEEDDGGVRSVSIEETGLLVAIRRGTYVEIRTMLPQPGYMSEIVKDVKVFHNKTKAL
jgi:hypothetical protein